MKQFLNHLIFIFYLKVNGFVNKKPKQSNRYMLYRKERVKKYKRQIKYELAIFSRNNFMTNINFFYNL